MLCDKKNKLGSAWMRGKRERKENREERKYGRKCNPLSCLDGGGENRRKENE